MGIKALTAKYIIIVINYSHEKEHKNIWLSAEFLYQSRKEKKAAINESLKLLWNIADTKIFIGQFANIPARVNAYFI